MRKGLLWMFVFVFFLVSTSLASAYDLTDGLVSYYSFDVGTYDTETRIIEDLHNGYNLTGSNVRLFGSSGVFGYGLDFTGGNYYANRDFSITPVNYSFGFWFRTPQFDANRWLVSGYSATSSEQYPDVFLSATSKLLFRGSSSDSGITTNTEFSTNTWYYVVVTAETNNRTVYVNGVMDSSTLSGAGNSVFNSNIVLGVRGTSSYYFAGLLDEFAFWNRTLSVEEVSFLYNITYDDFINVVDSEFLVTAKNYYDNSSILNFSVSINGTVYNTTNGTVNTGLYHNNTGLYNITFSSDNFFSRTYEDYNISSSGNLQGVLYESIIDFKLYSKVSNSSISNFTLVHSQGSSSTTNGTVRLYPASDSYTDWNFTSIQGDYYNLYNQTVNISSLDNKTINFYNAYNNILNISVVNAYTDNQISNFTGWIYNPDYAFNESFNTTVGFVLLFLEQDLNYSVYVEADGYAISNFTNFQDFTADNTTESLNFGLYSSNSIRLYFYNVDTGLAITDTNLTIVVSGESYEEIFYSASGSLFVENLTDGVYTVKVSGGNYSLASYDVTVADRSTQRVNVYLSLYTDEVIFTVLDYNTGQTIEGATVSMKRLINDTLTIVNSKMTDITGRVQLTYTPQVRYYFDVSKGNYTTKSFILDPVLFSSYNINLIPYSSGSAELDFTGVSITYSPESFIENTTSNFSFSISSSAGILSSYSFSLTLPNGTVYSDSGSNSYGETFVVSVFLDPSFDYDFTDNIVFTYEYDTTLSDSKSFTRFFSIIFDSVGDYTVGRLKDRDYGFGVLDMALISLIILVFGGGLSFYFGGLAVGSITSLGLFGMMVYIGFLPLWSVLPASILLFLFASKVGGGF